MTILQIDIIGKIRTAIDDIAPSTTDTFVFDADSELWQATKHAATELSLELPVTLLDASTESLAGSQNPDRGFSYSQLPTDFLRFISIDINGCAGAVRELMDPGSDTEKMQRSIWGRGTATKPKAMIDEDDATKLVMWWPGGTAYNSAELSYIAKPTEVDTTIECALRDEAERLLIYRAAGIYFEGKKEDTLAEKFRSLSNNY